jgi:hypothetical protein
MECSVSATAYRYVKVYKSPDSVFRYRGCYNLPYQMALSLPQVTVSFVSLTLSFPSSRTSARKGTPLRARTSTIWESHRLTALYRQALI